MDWPKQKQNLFQFLVSYSLETWNRDNSDAGESKKNDKIMISFENPNQKFIILYWMFMLVHGQTENMNFYINNYM